ncbi:hypothetical protein C5N14_00685 [Micromonospora sp. MW-13]|uniref:hypothetical protein n=1 Tax=Micromonospora sp. MW-13 TaxID=2094022 RepID=UPI000EDE783F|nr:hypothetical protein [Micromonospora sp. MW-13]RGC71004.1 hypothetical protein C5N14_00685 [Micromonospora sp. MW-13]
MPRHADRPSALAWQVFRASDAIRLGLVTAHRLRSSAWVNLRRDIYADSRLDHDHALSCRAVSLQLPPGAAFAGPSAALLHGVEHAAEFSADVHVASPRTAGLRSQRGLRVHLTDLPVTSPPTTPAPMLATTAALVLAPGAVLAPEPAIAPGPVLAPEPTVAAGAVLATGVPPATNPAVMRPAVISRDTGGTAPPPGRGGVGIAERRPGRPLDQGSSLMVAEAAWALPRTDPAMAAWETAVWLEPFRAVGIVDSLLRKGLTTRAALAGIGARNAERPGGRRARWVFDLADPGAQSPPESELRVRLVLAGLPRPVAQHPVRLASGLVLHPDLAWPQFRVAVEYDGTWHADAEQLHRDRQRLNQLVGAGWLVLHVTGRRLRHDFPALAREVHATLASRGWRR